MSPILPGATLGILGGGQLGRMTAIAARSFGYRVLVMDPDPSCPASPVADRCFVGGWDDAGAATDLARCSDVVTLEIEQVALGSLEAAARYAPIRPGAALLGIVQDRIRQKNWLRNQGFPVGAYCAIESENDLQQAAASLGERIYLKGAHGGYDGRSQVKIHPENGGSAEEQLANAWRLLGQRACVAERAIPLEREISVMVARNPSGEIRVFPAATNHHEHQILSWSVIPSSIPAALEQQARGIAEEIAVKLGLEGVLAAEMFVTPAGELYVNELAPRPHNSYHSSERGCVTSQFEQAVRAVCDLPLGDVRMVRPAAIANLLGELWLEGHLGFDRALAVPEVRLHLYEKRTPRKGRKMGHLSATADTPEEAVARVLEAKRRL